jgi:hypothetical protein
MPTAAAHSNECVSARIKLFNNDLDAVHSLEKQFKFLQERERREEKFVEN